MLRACVLLVSVCVAGAGLSGRGFFCRDPDSGKLYAVNSTWPASSFCGNYHCRLRRKNITENEYPPIRQINITSVKLVGDNKTKEVVKNETSVAKKQVEEIVINTEKKTEPDILNEMQVQDILTIDGNKDSKFDETMEELNSTERDRYLTDKEIKSISEILHTVKKSDLDAIVEIYNLAQDIYKEIDKTSTDQALEEVLYTAKPIENVENQPESRTAKKSNRVSYWYEPLNNGKIRPIEQLRNDLQRNEVVSNDVVPVLPAVMSDMEVQSSNIIQVTSTLPSLQKIQVPLPVTIAPRIKQMTDTYFNGPLSNKDFGKLPYYYPMSNFQRLSSYVHPPQAKMPIPILPLPKPTFKPVTYRPQYYIGGKYQKEIRPSILLPYPFSNIRHYNWSYPQNIFHSRSQKDYFEARKKANQIANAKYHNKLNNAVLMNPDLENFQDLEVKLTRKEDKLPISTAIQKIKEEKRRPEWQTDPLPNHVIEEVRAEVDEKQRILKPFPFRKRVKLERVGKVRKMDELKRSKRSNDDKSVTPKAIKNPEQTLDNDRLLPELYEVYLERTTCNSDYTVPGYFRYGNLSEPFPNCCPQRISGH